MSVFMAVDPSINYCGYAVYSGKKLISCGIIKTKTADKKETLKDFSSKTWYIVEELKKIKKKNEVEFVVLEIPEYWGASGYIARESGSIFKLVFLCGVICGSFKGTITYTPSQWKKQLPKEVVRNRLVKAMPNVDFSKLRHDIVDAIGIGYFHVHGRIGKKVGQK